MENQFRLRPNFQLPLSFGELEDKIEFGIYLSMKLINFSNIFLK